MMSFFGCMEYASKRPWWILPVIVVAQFFCTSLWFAGNAVASDLVADFHLASGALGHLTSAVQLGFILGTLVFALLSIADRFPPSRVFLWSAILGAGFNVLTILDGQSLTSLLMLRFGTGFFLAGIYPVGMKIAADYFDQGLGKSLGFLVGALVVGTALPHLIRAGLSDFPWRIVMTGTSALALIGGLSMGLFVANGPFRKQGSRIQLRGFLHVFKNPKLQTAAVGYFGHMWELYTFWAFVPIMLHLINAQNHSIALNIPLWSFGIIAIGGLACVIGGYASASLGTKKAATLALGLSGLCCLASPLVLLAAPWWFALGFLLFWGMVVVADSPLFSTLVAQHADGATKGTALTLVNSIGFAITIFSIQLINGLLNATDSMLVFMVLAIGPAWGVFQILRSKA